MHTTHIKGIDRGAAASNTNGKKKTLKRGCRVNSFRGGTEQRTQTAFKEKNARMDIVTWWVGKLMEEGSAGGKHKAQAKKKAGPTPTVYKRKPTNGGSS